MPPDAHTRMKRTLLMVLLLLTYSGGGAIINVAVAWGCACLVRPVNGQDKVVLFDLGDDRLCGGYIGFEFGSCDVLWCLNWRRADFDNVPMPLSRQTVLQPPYWSEFHNGPGPLRDGIVRYYDEQARGWPIYSLACGTSFADMSMAGRIDIDSVPLADWPQKGGIGYRPRAIPLRPIASGFAINTLFYAAVLWVLLFGPGKIRRFIRARRGQCPACGYPIGTSEVCTECGGPILPRRGIGV